ncbi:hypothetical protein PAXRUDRAFT_18962 [Paxillus rubicundulus Ve08.2h10]|uniref:Uncharacterized protein n=1 Tax=Paxillus rubicundulus Ve08.2h10 TaxID=930991 RepID=A0A0D0D5Z9_9AGAM|nr:hypothetical protein PAXRUDRAFT_18962 [Paxillus rubicundulus Ve08.2h10]
MLPMQNPHNAIQPDYGTDCFTPTRQPLVVNFGISHEEAVHCLLEIWMVQNQLECQEWDIWQEAEADEARQEQEHILQEEEAVHQEERKKNCSKFLPFNDIKVASTIPIMPSPHALRKLWKGKYVELDYFTNKGLAEA